MVKQTKRTAMERKLLDEVAKTRFLECLREVNPKSVEGCAQLSYDAAEVFIAERRRRQSQQS